MIRAYKSTDYALIKGWCETKGISTLTPYTLPPTTYLFEHEGEPVVSVSLIAPNSKEIAYLEYFIASPAFKSNKRREMSQSLIKYVEGVARDMGYNKLTCLAPNVALSEYYESFGYSPNLSGLTLLVKEIR